MFQDDAKFDLYKNNIFVLWFQTYEDKYFFWLQVRVGGYSERGECGGCTEEGAGSY